MIGFDGGSLLDGLVLTGFNSPASAIIVESIDVLAAVSVEGNFSAVAGDVSILKDSLFLVALSCSDTVDGLNTGALAVAVAGSEVLVV